jgi:hypothetical protein
MREGEDKEKNELLTLYIVHGFKVVFDVIGGIGLQGNRLEESF